MRRLLISSLAVLAVAGTAAAEDITLRVHYAIPTIWSDAQTKLAEAFMAEVEGVTIEAAGEGEGGFARYRITL